MEIILMIKIEKITNSEIIVKILSDKNKKYKYNLSDVLNFLKDNLVKIDNYVLTDLPRGGIVASYGKHPRDGKFFFKKKVEAKIEPKRTEKAKMISLKRRMHKEVPETEVFSGFGSGSFGSGSGHFY